jgi:hypothetical protein
MSVFPSKERPSENPEQNFLRYYILPQAPKPLNEKLLPYFDNLRLQTGLGMTFEERKSVSGSASYALKTVESGSISTIGNLLYS